MKIKHKLKSLVAVGVAALIVLGASNVFLIDRVYESASYANVNTVPSLLNLDTALRSFIQMRLQLYRFALLNDPRQRGEVDASIAATRKLIDDTLVAYEPLLSDDTDRQMLAADRAALAEYYSKLAPVMAAIRDGKPDQARDLLASSAQMGDVIEAAFGKHLQYNVDLGNQGADAARAGRARAVSVDLGILAVAGLALAVLGIGLQRSIQSRLAEANRIAGMVADGDLRNDRGEERPHDELGELLRSLDRMRSSMADMVRDVTQSSCEVHEAATGLSAAAAQVAVSSGQQSDATSSAAASVEELTVSIDHVGASASDASVTATASGTLAQSSGDQVERASTQVGEVARSVDLSAQQMEVLTGQMTEIGKIAVVIRAVADQTNLLALNAAIEAARAGEQGRGFAVVADEVRKLAERTTSSAQEISTVIQRIEDGAQTVAGSLANSKRVAGEVASVAQAAGTSMHEIRTSTDSVKVAIDQISTALAEQRTASVEIANSVEKIAQMAEENSSAVSAVADTASDLVRVADSVRSRMASFRL